MLTPLSHTNTFVFLLLSFLFAHANTWAADPINTLAKSGWKYKSSGIAIDGYDTVAYFTQSKAVKGKEQYQSTWKGATWYFSSEENKNLFQTAPEKYAPQYGGYCAFGVVADALVKIDGESWSIVDNKLYLNYNNKWKKRWLKDTNKYIAEADAKFEDLLSSK